MNRRTGTIAAFLTFMAASGLAPVLAQNAQGQSWSEVKCARYTKSWTEALAKRGKQGLSREFLETHEAFLASGCTSPIDVCPRSEAELDFANVMVILAMNAGTASTFPPFRCHK
jgi:hypothetical protein